ncbi:hypothetical protein NDU88_003685 [Pleurodeles waltl]|uniref:Uncharacterized protein n=1 Tax=Pleurodeles waltl TaxID=8319 RepID=A0AAV7V1E0_PLEWA|nr:hypothetical protein NDU88_003685 [Pleurodeles waltl]
MPWRRSEYCTTVWACPRQGRGRESQGDGGASVGDPARAQGKKKGERTCRERKVRHPAAGAGEPARRANLRRQPTDSSR